MAMSSKEKIINMTKNEDVPLVSILRPSLTHQEMREEFQYRPLPKLDIKSAAIESVKAKCECSGSRARQILLKRFPLMQYLLNYSLKQDLVGDLVSGITVAIMHIPQGMAYALLAGVPPVVGIYTAFFPVLIYSVLASSQHCSMGMFAIVCLMMGKVTGLYAIDEESLAAQKSDVFNSSALYEFENASDIVAAGNGGYTATEVATAVTFLVAMWEILFALLNLGALSVFLSEMLVSGFTTGAAVHVLTSQVKHLFGLKIPRYHGPFKIIYTYRDIFSNLLRSNPAATIVSAITISILVINNEFLKPMVRKKTRIPIPIELMMVILGTFLSYYLEFHEDFGVRIVGFIPTGFPEPRAPAFDLFGTIFADSFLIAVIGFTGSFSMAKIFAKRHGYSLDATQELLAQGTSNILGSFMSCAPMAASLSRTCIQEGVGGVTQFTSVISCSILVFILLFVGPLFETLPNCVLSSIIIVALKGLFLQAHDFKAIWRLSKLDSFIWMVPFLTTVIIDIDYGLLFGVITSIVILVYRMNSTKTFILGRIPGSEVYVDVKTYSSSVELPGMKIIQLIGSIHFINQESLRNTIYELSDCNPRIIKENQSKQEKQAQSYDNEAMEDEESKANGSSVLPPSIGDNDNSIRFEQPEISSIILDLGSVPNLDSMGGKLLKLLQKEYAEVNINLYLSGVSDEVNKMLIRTEIFNEESMNNSLFPTVHDAVTRITSRMSYKSEPLIYNTYIDSINENGLKNIRKRSLAVKTTNQSPDDSLHDETFSSQHTLSSPTNTKIYLENDGAKQHNIPLSDLSDEKSSTTSITSSEMKSGDENTEFEFVATSSGDSNQRLDRGK